MGPDLSAIKDLRYADPMPDLTKYPQTAPSSPMTISLDPKLIKRIDAIEAKLEEFEEYFTTIESILFKIQAVYEAIKEQGDHD